jgi:hypothetical protein
MILFAQVDIKGVSMTSYSNYVDKNGKNCNSAAAAFADKLQRTLAPAADPGRELVAKPDGPDHIRQTPVFEGDKANVAPQRKPSGFTNSR